MAFNKGDRVVLTENTQGVRKGEEGVVTSNPSIWDGSCKASFNGKEIEVNDRNAMKR